MTETKLISIRVPVDLLEQIDTEAKREKFYTRSWVIINYLQAVFDTADDYTRFVLSTWANRKKQSYKLTISREPATPGSVTLSSRNLITP